MKHATKHRLIPVAFLFLLVFAQAHAQTDLLPSWNEGAAKKSIVEFVKTTTDKGNPKFVPPEARIATFDQDGTTWVEKPTWFLVANNPRFRISILGFYNLGITPPYWTKVQYTALVIPGM